MTVKSLMKQICNARVCVRCRILQPLPALLLPAARSLRVGAQSQRPEQACRSGQASAISSMPAARSATRRLPRDERTAKIMAVARTMLSEKGYENILTAEIAQRCAISEATIYQHFASKRDLLIKVAEQWFEELLREQRPSLVGRTAKECLHQVVWASLSVVRREPALTRFVLLDLRPDPAYRSMPVFELNRRFTVQVADVLEAGVKSGELQGDVPVRLLRDMVFGCIEHQTWAFIRGSGDFSVDEVTEGIVTVIYRGMRAGEDKAKSTGSNAGTAGLIEALERIERVAGRLERVVR
jgi:TetR/AcrR family transcriptional regulator, fatty acid metabolism regulator protein